MALIQSYANQSDIPESLREHYNEKDGRWIIDTDPPMQDNAGAVAALNTERGLRREAEKQLTEYKVRYEGIDPEEVKRLRERVRGLDESEIYDKQGIDALVARRTQSMKEEHERIVNVKDREINQNKDKAQQFETRWRQDRIKTALTGAAVLAGVEKGAVEDAVRRGMVVFTDVDEQGVVLAKNGEDIRYGKDGITPLAPEEFFAALKPIASHLFGMSSGSGAPGQNGQPGAGFDWNSIANPAERRTRFREAQQAQQR